VNFHPWPRCFFFPQIFFQHRYQLQSLLLVNISTPSLSIPRPPLFAILLPITPPGFLPGIPYFSRTAVVLRCGPLPIPPPAPSWVAGKSLHYGCSGLVLPRSSCSRPTTRRCTSNYGMASVLGPGKNTRSMQSPSRIKLTGCGPPELYSFFPGMLACDRQTGPLSVTPHPLLRLIQDRRCKGKQASQKSPHASSRVLLSDLLTPPVLVKVPPNPSKSLSTLHPPRQVPLDQVV